MFCLVHTARFPAFGLRWQEENEKISKYSLTRPCVSQYNRHYVKRFTLAALQFRLSRAMRDKEKGEIMVVHTKGEQNDILLLARAHNWDVITKKDGKNIRVIVP